MAHQRDYTGGYRADWQAGGNDSQNWNRGEGSPGNAGWAAPGNYSGRGYGETPYRDFNNDAGNTGDYGGAENYAGRGPRNYQRSADRIRDDVNEDLTRHPGIDASDIEVDVSNGEVTLSGTVHSRRAKRMAEDVAESCSGVKDVHNQLRVDQAGQTKGTQPTNQSHSVTDREVPRHAERESPSSGSHNAGSAGNTSNNPIGNSSGKANKSTTGTASTSNT